MRQYRPSSVFGETSRDPLHEIVDGSLDAQATRAARFDMRRNDVDQAHGNVRARPICGERATDRARAPYEDRVV